MRRFMRWAIVHEWRTKTGMSSGVLARAEQTPGNVQAIIQVASKLPVRHHLLQIAMRSRNHTSIHLLCTGTAQSFNFTFLQTRRNLGRSSSGMSPTSSRAGALVCNLEAPVFAHGGAGKCAPLMPKSSLSSNPEGMAAQFSLTRGRSRRGLRCGSLGRSTLFPYPSLPESVHRSRLRHNLDLTEHTP